MGVEVFPGVSYEWRRGWVSTEVTEACMVVTILSPAEAIRDSNWNDRGIFTPVSDPIYGDIVVAQAQ